MKLLFPHLIFSVAKLSCLEFAHFCMVAVAQSEGVNRRKVKIKPVWRALTKCIIIIIKVIFSEASLSFSLFLTLSAGLTQWTSSTQKQLAKDAPLLQSLSLCSLCCVLCMTYLGAGHSAHWVCARVQPCLLRHKHPLIKSCHLSPIWWEPGTCEGGGWCGRGVREAPGNLHALMCEGFHQLDFS